MDNILLQSLKYLIIGTLGLIVFLLVVILFVAPGEGGALLFTLPLVVGVLMLIVNRSRSRSQVPNSPLLSTDTETARAVNKATVFTKFAKAIAVILFIISGLFLVSLFFAPMLIGFLVPFIMIFSFVGAKLYHLQD